jgi:hypothetical protein
VQAGGGAPPDGKAAIAECDALAQAAGVPPTGGEIAGMAYRSSGGTTTGATTGSRPGPTTDFIKSVLEAPAPNPAYRAYVERCLRDRGYAIVAWQ